MTPTMDRNEENDEEQLDGASSNSDSTTYWHSRWQCSGWRSGYYKTVHNPTVDNLEKWLEATELDENEANL